MITQELYEEFIIERLIILVRRSWPEGREKERIKRVYRRIYRRIVAYQYSAVSCRAIHVGKHTQPVLKEMVHAYNVVERTRQRQERHLAAGLCTSCRTTP